MFERFTERARQVVVLSHDEARLLKHSHIGTEHILLGLLREEEGIAARVLESLGVTVEEVRAQVVRIVGAGDAVAGATGQIPMTPPAKKVLELSLREALALGHNYVGTEHILLGLLREKDGAAAQILLDLAADSDKIRNEVIGKLSDPAEGRSAPHPRPGAHDDPPHDRRPMPRPKARLATSAPRVRSRRARRTPTESKLRGPLYAAIGCAAAAFPLGLLAGWLIWA